MSEDNPSSKPLIYSHLLQDVDDGHLLLDDEGVVISVSTTAAGLLGCVQEALIGKPWHSFWPQELPPPGELEDGRIYHCLAAESRQGDQGTPIALSTRRLLASSGTHQLVRINRLASLNQLDEALSNTQKLAGIGTLTASVAHEINTPISVITATCSNLLREVDTGSTESERLSHYVNMIERSAWRCARIVNVLRNYTTDDALRTAVTDLNTVIEDAVALVLHQFEGDFNVTIGLELEESLRSIVCDHNRLTQVVVNLLHNARDAMVPGGGQIKLRTWQVQEVPAELASEGEGSKEEFFAFSVTDSGSGITPEIEKRLFSPFFTTKTGGQGTGLGLFVARRIVQQHGGIIWADNDATGGATFTVVLPRKQAHTPDHMDTIIGT